MNFLKFIGTLILALVIIGFGWFWFVVQLPIMLYLGPVSSILGFVVAVLYIAILAYWAWRYVNPLSKPTNKKENAS